MTTLFKRVDCKSIETRDQDEWSDVSMAKIDPDGIEIYPAVCKTISLSLVELKAIVAEMIVAEIEALTEEDE